MEIISSDLSKVLHNIPPSRIVYSPNYWQWFAYHKNHNILPAEIRHCESQADLLKYLGVDIFSRNIYCRQDEYWFGGICDEYLDGSEVKVNVNYSGQDKVTVRSYRLPSGELSETLLYVFKEATVVQKEFLVNDYSSQQKLLEEFVSARRWKFNPAKYRDALKFAGPGGIVMAGEFFSPLKMLHLTMGPVNSVYFLLEYPELARSILDIHEKAQLDLLNEVLNHGIKQVISMDNLDTMFHPPDYVENYSAGFYEKASRLCHENGAKFFIHACGQQKANLGLISSLGVDGLEGVAFPPLGDVELEEAMKITHDHFIITGGISAMETRNLSRREDVFRYVRDLFDRMRPYSHRFIFSSSCNTSIDTKWETILNFRDAWLEYRNNI